MPVAPPRILLMLLLQHLDQEMVRWCSASTKLWNVGGPKIKARGVYRDAVRFQGQRPALMWLGHVPWAGRYWALPFLSAGALGTLPPAARTATRSSPTGNDLATAPLAAPPPPGAGGRQQLRRLGPAPLLPIVGSTRYPHRPLGPPFMNRPHPVSPVRTVGLRFAEDTAWTCPP